MNFYDFITTNVDYSMLILFGLILTIFLVVKKKRVELQKILFPLLYLILYKTKWGLSAMDNLAKKVSNKARDRLSTLSITIGFVGMAFITYAFLKSVYTYFFVEQEMVVAPLLPGATIPGLPSLSFIHWIIAIFILATVHEFSHGLFARMHKIKVKSSGFAFMGIILPIIPAAFVEPDEESMEKASKKAQLAVLSAGTFANFITAAVFLILLSLVSSPLVALSLSQQDGVLIGGIESGGPSEGLGLEIGERILKLNGIEINNVVEFMNLMNQTSPFEKVELKTDNDLYYITLGEHPERDAGYIGLQLTPDLKTSSKILIWFHVLIYWLFFTNLMVGLINLLPLGIVDGGRMFYLALFTFIKNEKIAKNIFVVVSAILLLFLLFFLIPALINYFAAPFS